MTSSEPILVVEDNEPNRILAIRLLERLGYAAVAVHNGREAIQAIERQRPPLVLMDCQMPEMDGFQATQLIRAGEAGTGSPLPIIAMTASVTERDREACFAAGMDDIVTKPVMIAALSEVVARWHPAGGPALLPPSPAARPTPTYAQAPFQVDVLARLRDDLAPLAFNRFLDAYLQELPERMAAIAAAIDEGSGDGLRLVAHTLKSTSAALGASTLASLCGKLEALGAAAKADEARAHLKAFRAECRAVSAALGSERAAMRAAQASAELPSARR